MRQDNDPILIYTTFETIDDARIVGGALVKLRLAACVNIIPSMISIYEWQGELGENSEVVMLIKTRKACQAKVLSKAKELHPYDTPALLVIEPGAFDCAFADWIVEQTDSS